MQPRLIPELDVSALKESLKFYCDTLGFTLLYDRPEEMFAMLELEGARIMLEEIAGPGRRFRAEPVEKPFGQGVNFQIQVSDVDSLYERCGEAEAEILIPLEERWYRSGQMELGNRQFVTVDPDGYLLRFYKDLGSRPKL